MHVLPQPKKPRATKVREESVKSIISATQTQHRTTQATRAAAAANDLTTKNVQALVDTFMDKYHPKLPRAVVTAKAFGVFRKRVVDARVQDLPRFLEYTIREWTVLATQNRMALMRNPDKAKAGSPLPEAPNFTALAYRLPYFLAAYANRAATSIQDERGTLSENEKRIAALESQLQNLRRTNAYQAEMISRITAKKRTASAVTEAPASKPVLRRTRPDSDPLAEQVDLPEWEDGPQTKVRRAAR